jgi:hypothetical protein
VEAMIYQFWVNTSVIKHRRIDSAFTHSFATLEDMTEKHKEAKTEDHRQLETLG